MCNHSYSIAIVCNKLDYLGILVLMWGAGIPTIYYGFFCNLHLRLLYCIMVRISWHPLYVPTNLSTDEYHSVMLCYFYTKPLL